MSDSMLERMAAAIDPEAFGEPWIEGKMTDTQMGRCHGAVTKARAVAEAMREPSEGIINSLPVMLRKIFIERWQWFIDAILAGK